MLNKNQPHIAAHTAATQGNPQTKAAVRAAITARKNILLVLTSVIILFTVNSCASKKVLNSTGITAITFGSGGGSTNAITKYQITTNRELFEMKTLEKTTREIKRISKAELKSIYKMIDKLSKEQLKFSHPGNLYYFIELEKSKEKINIAWGDPSFAEPVEIRELYEYLNNLIKQ